MSRKTHPIGFRLGMSQEWIINTPLNTSYANILKQYVLFMWLNNFAQQHHFYFLRHNELLLTENISILFLLGFFPRLSKTRIRRRTTHLRFLESASLFKKKRRKKQKRLANLNLVRDVRIAVAPAILRFLAFLPGGGPLLRTTTLVRQVVRSQSSQFLSPLFCQKSRLFSFGRYWQARYLYWDRLRLRRRRTKQKRYNHVLLYLPNRNYNEETVFKTVTFRRKRRRFHRFKKVKFFRFKKRFRPVRVPTFLTLSTFRAKKLVRRKYFKSLWQRFSLLRFKFYLQAHLNTLMRQQYVIVLQNFTDFAQAKSFIPQTSLMRTLGRKLYNGSQFLLHRMFSYRQYNFLSIFVGLVLGASYVRTPHVLLQWLWNYSARVKKHSLYITHRQLFNLFFTTLENSILLVGILKGVRLEAVGKLYNSTRTRKQLLQFGKSFKRQTIFSGFIYTMKHIPTYLGVLGFRLWFLY